MSERAMERVLVIDDDELSREVLELLLVDVGYEVSAAPGGQEGLDALGAGGCPEVVLMDLQMPGLCGAALVGRLRVACPEGTHVIAMSGSVPGEGMPPAGADGFLLKPFSMEAFAAELERLRVGGEAVALQAGDAVAAVLDEAVFGSFRGMVGDVALRELYEACLRDAEAGLEGMQVTESAGDYGELRKIAHALKGSLGMLGARELERRCVALETGSVNAPNVITLTEFRDGIQRLRGRLTDLGMTLR